MIGRAQVVRERQRLDATFERAKGASDDAELLSDFAKYLCILVTGYLEQSVIELVLEYVERRSDASVHRHVSSRMRRFTSPNSQALADLMGSFDPQWQKNLESYLVDERKDAVDSVVNLRHTVSHGRSAGVTMARIARYYESVKEVVDRIADLCAHGQRAQ